MIEFNVASEIQQAIDAGQPVVALESALITHGFAYPANVDITLRMAEAIRDAGAIPAVIGIWRGEVCVGLSDAQVETLATDTTAAKVSVRDLPLIGVRGVHGGTTVATTTLLAHRAGIRVFATGGIGGVHRGHPEDISADLPVLASTPLIVVCAGAKSILDVPRTLEYLETWGVPVSAGGRRIPAFTAPLPACRWINASMARSRSWASSGAAGARLARKLLVRALPAEDEIPAESAAHRAGRRRADTRGSHRRPSTIYLARMVALRARTKHANESLLLNNARIAAHIACSSAALR